MLVVATTNFELSMYEYLHYKKKIIVNIIKVTSWNYKEELNKK
jgi:hypothetical protein